ncbi:TNF receptor-associated factor 3-like isoform X2 [Ruditapes philippinarum]|nr:TNF receptor-associated factor 3-like isoform X2 [Ruditapes philippinarum]XP_060585114.1 TNF receptor-associated factor 3-like isoform X2 [Ruditapes philippinarum]XP_060585115.1 TNF receptor-associated factor 3-like isoform X2 [Ruditapes philippinarum]XP_060585116.1 TNF receptor-associated factor 3-like isoform X2 [Ruditapes philippinarum]XP_060585117.1 TNF receptor-associated factor 3-like isoform X2 [Ruditapes philippinarum]XP_060585118.1 TNF receptor-associated factor 3-like isoform X2 [
MMTSNSSLELQENPKFFRHDSKYDCLVCKEVLKEAMQTSCGHRICERCIAKLFEGKSEPVMCPANEEDCEPQCRTDITPDPSGRREIRNLKVYCDYKDKGCDEVVRWKDLQGHMSNCKFKPITCPNHEFGCETSLTSTNFQQHIQNECEYRQKECQFCKIFVPAKLLQKHFDDECLVVQLACPYSCGSQPMARTELRNHMETCPSKPKECRFKSVGCDFKGTDEQVQHHLVTDLNKHLENVTLYTANMEVQSIGIRRELQEVTAERDQLRQEVNVVRQEMAVMKTNFEKVQNSNKELKLKMVSLTERVIHLEKQSENAAKKDVVERHDRDVRTMQTSLTQVRAQVVQLERLSLNEGGRSGSGETAPAPELKRRLDMHDSQFAQLDVQMAELDLRFQILETASYDGTLMWKLRDYARRKQDAVQGRTLSLYSQPFYTHRYGYKMCARVYLNGDGMGKGSHMSLFFVVMRGEYDNLLPWPFQQKVTMTLLDQETGQCNLSDSFRPDPTSSSFRKPTTDMNIASGCPLFVSHAVLETAKYVKEDTIMIKFQVDLANLNHP